MNAIERTLTEAERDLLRETEPARMAELDEDTLLELHGRIRRARTKYVKLYRREASARVAATGGRGAARPKNRRNAEKAEVFEAALARVSRRLGVVARQAAADLKAERLAAARRGTSRPATEPTRAASERATTSRAPAHRKTTGGKKRDASTRATGARRQAARDSR